MSIIKSYHSVALPLYFKVIKLWMEVFMTNNYSFIGNDHIIETQIELYKECLGLLLMLGMFANENEYQIMTDTEKQLSFLSDFKEKLISIGSKYIVNPEQNFILLVTPFVLWKISHLKQVHDGIKYTHQNIYSDFLKRTNDRYLKIFHYPISTEITNLNQFLCIGIGKLSSFVVPEKSPVIEYIIIELLNLPRIIQMSPLLVVFGWLTNTMNILKTIIGEKNNNTGLETAVLIDPQNKFIM